jgi:hypothetical protein
MLKKKFDKTSVTINRVLKAISMAYFICIHVMPKPVEPDNMKIEENFDIFDLRRSAKNKKKKKALTNEKPRVIYDIPWFKQKKSCVRSAVAKSVKKKEDPIPEIRAPKKMTVNSYHFYYARVHLMTLN